MSDMVWPWSRKRTVPKPDYEWIRQLEVELGFEPTPAPEVAAIQAASNVSELISAFQSTRASAEVPPNPRPELWTDAQWMAICKRQPRGTYGN